MPVPPRGLRDIHTHTERGKNRQQPYKSYMQLSALEMERTRQMQERQNAAARIVAIDARMQEIDALEEEILISLGKQTVHDTAVVSIQSDPETQTAGFVFRY